MQHKHKCYKSGTVTLATVESPMVLTKDESIEGNSYIAVVEFKMGCFAIDQTLANLLCSAADGSVEILRHGKQIIMVVVYGLSVNYEARMAKYVIH